jgi:hypothetical protein
VTIIGGIGGYVSLIIALMQLSNQKPKARFSSALQFQNIVFRNFMISIPIQITNYRNMPVSIGDITGNIETDTANMDFVYIGANIIADSSREPGRDADINFLDRQPIISIASHGCRIAMMNFASPTNGQLPQENVNVIKIRYRILSEDIIRELIIRP